MPTFRYVARTPEGREVRGTVQANSRLEATDAVRKQGYWLLELYAEPEPRTPVHAAQHTIWQPLFGGVPLKVLAVFFRQFATTMAAGVPMYQALTTLSNQRGLNARLQRVITDIRDRVLAGESLADAFDKHPAVFSPIIRAMVRVGETSGALERVLRLIATYLENELELRRLISRVTLYPKIVLFFAIVIPQLIPALITLVGGQGGAPVGQVLLGIGQTFLMIFLVIFAIWALFRIAMQAYGFRYAWGLFTVSLPWLGFTVRQLALARFARALSALYNAGLPLSQAIRYAADATGNEYLRSRLLPAGAKLEAGYGITQTFASTGVFPPMVMDMVATGENTGELSFMMDKVAEYYEEEGKLRSYQAGHILGVAVYIGVAIYVAIILIQFYAGYFSAIFGAAGQP
ncbi:MAG: type II secretion system F family protein [Fimbriimonadales bacterium]|nr:type II secretion system F family protein [Fimbriimonadales bacterium]